MLLVNYIGKLNFKKKRFFRFFDEKWRRDVWDIFVEWIKHYHNLKVQGNCIFYYQDEDLEMKTLDSNEKKVIPNCDA